MKEEILKVKYLFYLLVAFVLYCVLIRPWNHKGDGQNLDLKLVCWMPIIREEIETGLEIKNNGWGKYCKEFLLLSDFEDEKNNIHDITNVIHLERTESYDDLALKIYHCWAYLYEKYYHDKDSIFLKADTDTYMIMDNYKKFISRFDISIPFYIGRNMKEYENTDIQYNQGGAGITINHATLRLMINQFNLPNDSPNKVRECTEDFFKAIKREDLAIGLCLKELGINPAFTRDDKDRELFMYYGVEKYYYTKMEDSDKDHWYKTISFNNKFGPDCCSPLACSFHKITREFQKQKLVYNNIKEQWEWG